jgi:hypothetical protein
VYETGLVNIYLIIANGWTFFRDVIDAEEWRSLVLCLTIFYIANSILLVGRESFLDNRSFLVGSLIVYGFAYYCIISSYVLTCLVHLRPALNGLSKLLDVPSQADDENGIADITTVIAPLQQKRRMFVFFIIFVFVSLFGEVLAQSLLRWDARSIALYPCYEILHLCVIASLMLVFRPMEFSPFFFLVPIESTEDGSGLITIIDAKVPSASDAPDSAGAPGSRRRSSFLRRRRASAFDDKPSKSVPTALELAPLIRRSEPTAGDGEVFSSDSSMVVIKDPRNELSVGLRVRKKNNSERTANSDDTSRTPRRHVQDNDYSINQLYTWEDSSALSHPPTSSVRQGTPPTVMANPPDARLVADYVYDPANTVEVVTSARRSSRSRRPRRNSREDNITSMSAPSFRSPRVPSPRLVDSDEEVTSNQRLVSSINDID